MKLTNEKGAALLATIIIILTIILAGGVAMMSWSRKGYKYAVKKTDDSRMFYIADSGIRYAMRRIITHAGGSSLDLSEISNDFMAITAAFIPNDEFEITKYTINEVTTNGLYSGDINKIFILEKAYDIRCQVALATPPQLPSSPSMPFCNNQMNSEGGEEPENYAEVSGVLGDFSVSIFQFGLYYQEMELELHPGSTVTKIGGKVHSNKSMYLAPYGSIKFLDSVTCADGIYHGGFAGDIRRRRGTGSIYFKDENGTFKNMKTNSSRYSFLDSNDPEWKIKSLERWDGSIRTKDHDIGTIQLPFENSLSNTRVLVESDPCTNEPYSIAKHRFENKAGLVITMNGDVYEQSGEITNAEYTSRVFLDNITNLNWAVSTNEFFNRRNMDYYTNDFERGMVYPIDIDIELFNDWVLAQPSSLSFKNPSSSRAGILYIEQTNATGHAVRISNAEELYPLPGGFSLATPNPLYVWGDYNIKIGGNYNTNYPSALLSDAMTILSENWTDEDNKVWPENIIRNRPSGFYSGLGKACNTTINTAIMTGSAITTENINEYRFSGAANNLVRYLENWNYREFKISGNQTCLWPSKYEWQHYIYRSQTDTGLDPWHYRWPSYRTFLYDESLKNRNPPGFDNFYTYCILNWEKIH